jgi:ATP synthase protein I
LSSNIMPNKPTPAPGGDDAGTEQDAAVAGTRVSVQDPWDDDPWDQEDEVVPLPVISSEMLARLMQEARRELLESTIIQWLVCAAVAVLAWIIGGAGAGLSALVGAAIYVVPNSLLAFRLLRNTLRPDGGSPATVLVGEFLKVGLVVALLWLTARLGGESLVWPLPACGAPGRRRLQPSRQAKKSGFVRFTPCGVNHARQR